MWGFGAWRTATWNDDWRHAGGGITRINAYVTTRNAYAHALRGDGQSVRRVRGMRRVSRSGCSARHSSTYGRGSERGVLWGMFFGGGKERVRHYGWTRVSGMWAMVGVVIRAGIGARFSAGTGRLHGIGACMRTGIRGVNGVCHRGRHEGRNRARNGMEITAWTGDSWKKVKHVGRVCGLCVWVHYGGTNRGCNKGYGAYFATNFPRFFWRCRGNVGTDKVQQGGMIWGDDKGT